MSGIEPAHERIQRISQERRRQADREAVSRTQAVGAARERGLGAVRLLRASSLPVVQVEELRHAKGFRALGRRTFTISEYMSGKNESSTMQYPLYVARIQEGWYMPNIFPEQPYDSESRSIPARHLVVGEDGEGWVTMWQGCGSDGRVIGVPYDNEIVTGRIMTGLPTLAIERYIRENS